MPVTVALTHSAARPEVDDEDLLVVGVREGHLAEDEPDLDEGLAAAGGFTGAVAQTLIVAGDAGPMLLVGLGSGDPKDFRRVGAAAARAARRTSVVIDALGALDGADRSAAADNLAQGLVLGTYRFEAYKEPSEDPSVETIVVVGKGGRRTADAVERGVGVARAVTLVRDLVNTPGGDLTPVVFAKRATEVAEQAGLEVEVLDERAIKRERLGGLLGVSRGSTQKPRFVRLTHVPEGKPKGTVALVGKGVTFDSGGLSIKTSAGMEHMKTDMGGAAAVLGAMSLVPTMAPRMAVTAYLPLTDNMLGGDATRVGDVLRARNGKTIEVLNTDAEGRLILADALALAAEAEPDAIIDVATLTGAAMVALGMRTAGVMGNHDALRNRVLAAADDQGESAWPLPMPAYLRKQLDSPVADLRNIGAGPYGGASTAAIFLQEFVDDVAWAHIDIAGPSNTTAAYEEHAKGGTGFGVRTLIGLLTGWTRLPAE